MAKKQERPWDEDRVVRGKGGRFAKKPDLATEGRNAPPAASASSPLLSLSSRSLPNIPKEIILNAAEEYRRKNKGKTRFYELQDVIIPAAEMIADYVNSDAPLNEDEMALLMEGKTEAEMLEAMSQGQADKIARMKEAPGGDLISVPEAIGLRCYLEGTSNYGNMNSALRSDMKVIALDGGGIRAVATRGEGSFNFDNDGNLVLEKSEALVWMVRSRAATQALRKLPMPTDEALAASFRPDKGDAFDPRKSSHIREWEQMEGKRLARVLQKGARMNADDTMAIKDKDLKAFLESHQPGSVFTDRGFFSTYIPCKIGPTLAQMERINNVRYEIEWDQSNTTGRFVDHFKESTQENEILFPPSRQFEVIGEPEYSFGWNIRVREIVK